MNFRNAFNEVFRVEVPIAIVVFVVVCALVVFAMVRYRARPGREASKKSEHPIGEPTYVLCMILIAAGLASFVFTVNNQERNSPAGKPVMTVRITAFQWCWRFSYKGTPVTITGTCQTKAQAPTLVIPTGTVVRYDLTSADVVHEWWVPHFRWKMEAFPDHVNQWKMIVTKSGDWVGRCTSFCGLFHYRMDFRVRAVSPALFTAFMRAHGASASSATA
jgi:cytochrome c oxidase subunit 2